MLDFNLSLGSTKLRKLFYALFGSKTTTLADGTRQLVNEGVTGKDRIKNLTTGKSFGTQAAWIDNGDGSYTCDGKTGGGERDLYVTNIIEQGVTYIVEVEILDYVSGMLGWYFGGVSVIVGYSNGFHSYEATAGTTNTFTLHSWASDGFVGSIRNIKLYKKSDLAQHGTLHSGHGAYFNGVDNYIDNAGSISTVNGFTLLTVINPSKLRTYKRVLFSGQTGITTKNPNNELSVTVNDNHTTVMTYEAGVTYNIALSVNQDRLRYVFASDGNVVADNIAPVQFNSLLSNFFIGNRESLEAFFEGVISDVYAIPQTLTAEEIQSHYNNPEKTLYWENGTLKSAFLPQSTLDDMQAGNGFWYPLSENVSAGGYYRNHALPMPALLMDEGFESQGNWVTINSSAFFDGNAAVTTTASYGAIFKDNLGFAQSGFIIEFEVVSITNGQAVLNLYDQNNEIDQTTTSLRFDVGVHRVFSPIVGLKKVSLRLDTANETVRFDNIKVYPLANSGLAPMQNWQTTNTTNAQASQYGYQSLLMPSDEFGLQGDGDVAVVKQDNGKYFNGVDNYIDTGFIPDLSQDLTLLFSHDATLTETYEAATGSDGNRLFVLDNGSIGYGTSYFDKVASVKTDNGSYTTGLVYDSQTSTIKIYRNSIEVFSESVVVGSSLYSIYIGALNLTNSASKYYTNSVSDVYLIPQSLTAQEIEAHYRNPNRTLYWQGGVLKSDFLPQSTIDAMQAGEGFWYPLSGNESTGGYERNHALAMPENMLDGKAWTVDGVQWTEQDGVITGHTKGSLSYADIALPIDFIEGEAYVIDIEIETIDAQFTLYLRGAYTGSYSSNGLIRVVAVAGASVYTGIRLASSTFEGRVKIHNVYPLANSGLTPMQNWNTTNVTNALGVSTSTVTESYTVDEFGMQKDWPDAKPVITGELYGDGRSYVDMNDMVISGDFEIDFVSYWQDTDGANIYGGWSLVAIEGLNLGASGNGNSFVSGDTAFTPNIVDGKANTPFITTMQITYDNFLSYQNNMQTANVPFTTKRLSRVVGFDTTLNAPTGTLQITQGTRTDEQRAKDIQKLATKHGVII
jgi:hypothetical protein